MRLNSLTGTIKIVLINMMKRENFINIKFRLKNNTYTYIHIQLKFGIFGGEECSTQEIESWFENQIEACD